MLNINNFLYSKVNRLLHSRCQERLKCWNTLNKDLLLRTELFGVYFFTFHVIKIIGFELSIATRWDGGLTASIFVGTVGTVFLSVTEQTPFYTGTVTAGEESVLAEGFVGKQERFYLAFFVLELAVLYGVFPIAGLLVDVEV